MSPFLAEDDQGKPVVVLQFVVAFYGTTFAVVTDPKGGRVWTIEVSDLRHAWPTGEWPIVPDRVPA